MSRSTPPEHDWSSRGTERSCLPSNETIGSTAAWDSPDSILPISVPIVTFRQGRVRIFRVGAHGTRQNRVATERSVIPAKRYP